MFIELPTVPLLTDIQSQVILYSQSPQRWSRLRALSSALHILPPESRSAWERNIRYKRRKLKNPVIPPNTITIRLSGNKITNVPCIAKEKRVTGTGGY